LKRKLGIKDDFDVQITDKVTGEVISETKMKIHDTNNDSQDICNICKKATYERNINGGGVCPNCGDKDPCY